MTEAWLAAFITESNRIEGIKRQFNDAEANAHERFLALGKITVEDVSLFVTSIAGIHTVLRDREGINVSVGNHIPIPGGMAVRGGLGNILFHAMSGKRSPYDVHCDYETLHPYTDGNGRSGRVLWLWMMLRSPYAERAKQLGFLHCWYYQSLERIRHD